MKELSMSVSPGLGFRKHNSDGEYRSCLDNVDPARTSLNVTLFERDLVEVYEEEFGESLRAYNAKQSRPERRIDSYYEKIKNSKQENLEYELVIQIGNKDTNPADDESCRRLSKDVYHDFLSSVKGRYPQMALTAAYVHLDEATPHLHLDFVPISKNNARGLATKNSYRGMLKDMGYKSEKEFERTQEFRRDLSNLLEKAAFRNGIERLDMQDHHKHLPVREFKAEMRRRAFEDYNNNPELVGAFKNLQACYDKLLAEYAHVLEDQNELKKILGDKEKGGLGRSKRIEDKLEYVSQFVEDKSTRYNQNVSRFRGARKFIAEKVAKIPLVGEKWSEYIMGPKKSIRSRMEELSVNPPINKTSSSLDDRGAGAERLSGNQVTRKMRNNARGNVR